MCWYKLIIFTACTKRTFRDSVARQLALSWQPFCAPPVEAWPVCYHPSMKLK